MNEGLAKQVVGSCFARSAAFRPCAPRGGEEVIAV